MPAFAFFAAALSLAAQQPDPPIGQRTTPPEQLLATLGLAPGSPEEDPAVAAAAAFPLGSMENPVRVGGPDGELAYLTRLRCGDGRAPHLGQRTEAGVGAFGSIVGAFLLDCGAALPGRATLILDRYHDEHREDRAPPGFTITSRAGG